MDLASPSFKPLAAAPSRKDGTDAGGLLPPMNGPTVCTCQDRPRARTDSAGSAKLEAGSLAAPFPIWTGVLVSVIDLLPQAPGSVPAAGNCCGLIGRGGASCPPHQAGPRRPLTDPFALRALTGTWLHPKHSRTTSPTSGFHLRRQGNQTIASNGCAN